MAKTKSQKKEILKNLEEKIKTAKSIVFASFNALGVKDNNQLRKDLKREGGEYYVAKKTLLNLAMKNGGYEEMKTSEMPGQLAAVFSYEDEIAPAKVIDQFRKKNEGKIEFLGGILENKFLSAAETAELANIPSKPELYARIVGSLNAPISGLVNVMAGNLRSLVYVLKAIEESKK